MLRAMPWIFALRGLAVALALAVGGCGEKKPEPILDLTEEHKQQLEELNKQRAAEWGNKK